MRKINKRPGYPVCIYNDGRYELYDPSAWRRAEWQRIKKQEEQERERQNHELHTER